MIFPPASISVLAWFRGVMRTGPDDVGKTWVWLSAYEKEARKRTKEMRRSKFMVDPQIDSNAAAIITVGTEDEICRRCYAAVSQPVHSPEWQSDSEPRFHSSRRGVRSLLGLSTFELNARGTSCADIARMPRMCSARAVRSSNSTGCRVASSSWFAKALLERFRI